MNNILLATLTCPNPTCRHQQQILMPTTFCQLTYTCEACSMTHAHKSGDCCVFCSYADKPCLSVAVDPGHMTAKIWPYDSSATAFDNG